MAFWRGPQKKLLLGLLFFVAPVDVSKAIVPPLDRIYSPGLYVTVAEAVMVLLGVVWATDRLFRRHLALPFTRLDAFGFGFLVLSLIHI